MEPPSYDDVNTNDARKGHTQRWKVANASALEPWLQLRARLFLCILSPALVSLLLVGVHVATAARQADVQADDLKDQLMNACHDAERAASVLVSVPHYFAENFNDATKRSIDDTVHGLATVLMLSVTAIEQLLVFLVDMYRSFYLCVIELIVRGSLAVIQAVVNALSGAIHDVAQSIKTALQGSISGINATLRGSLGGVNDILKIVGKSISVPQVTMPDLSALDNVQLPSSFDAGLTNLNNSLPTLSELKQSLDALIETPFERLKAEINSTIATYSFDRSTLPIPSNQSITFCDSQNVTLPITALNQAFHHAANIGLCIVALFALLLICACLVLEWLRWRSLNRLADRMSTAYDLSGHQGDGIEIQGHKASSANDFESRRSVMSLLSLSAHPFLAEQGLRLARRMGVTDRSKIARLRWSLAWISHTSLIAVLVMGIVGFIGAQCQIWAIESAVHHSQKTVAGMAQVDEDHVRTAVNAQLAFISADYANRTNTVIQGTQDNINNRLLSWVNTTTSTMNDTLNAFEAGIAEVLNSTFLNTPLYTPIQSFVGCILLNKIDEIEQGLTWIHNNAHVTLPTIPEDALLLGANQTQAFAQPIQDKVVGDGTANSGIVSRLASTYLDGLERQRTLFLCLIATYFIIALFGALIALLHRDEVKEYDEKQEGFTSSDTYTSDLDRARPAKLSHASISAPLLDEVVRAYHEQQKKREETQEAAAQEFAARAIQSRLRGEMSSPTSLSQDGRVNDAEHDMVAGNETPVTTMSLFNRPHSASIYSMQAPSSHIERTEGSRAVDGRASPSLADRSVPPPTTFDQAYGYAHAWTTDARSLCPPNEITLVRHAMPHIRSFQHGVAM